MVLPQYPRSIVLESLLWYAILAAYITGALSAIWFITTFLSASALLWGCFGNITTQLYANLFLAVLNPREDSIKLKLDRMGDSELTADGRPSNPRGWRGLGNTMRVFRVRTPAVLNERNAPNPDWIEMTESRYGD
ncbi:hypothetical protein C8Q76DRAFT_261686 [Earliella scabrosa]|nr:hypothetical protein C8Q76DRAFT_261686 [Earliella scabrosa]